MINSIRVNNIQNRIYTIRGLQVMIDRDLAELYSVETRVLNQAVKRNIERFPPEFMFQLTLVEFKRWKSQVEVKNENYNVVEPTLPNFELTEEELNNAIDVLKQQFAEYKDVDTINIEKSYVKLDLEYLDENGSKVGDGKVFLTKQDFEEFPILKEVFEKKEKGYSTEFDYTEDLPTLLKYFKKDKDKLNIKKVKAIVSEIKEPVLPELTLENIEKWFGKKYEKLEKFIEEVKKNLEVDKRRIELNKFVEDLLNKIKDSFEVILPKTLIDQEVKQRLENLKQRYG